MRSNIFETDFDRQLKRGTLVGYKLVGTAGDILAQTSEIRFFRWKKKWFNVRAENLDSFWKKKMGGGNKVPPQPAD